MALNKRETNRRVAKLINTYGGLANIEFVDGNKEQDELFQFLKDSPHFMLGCIPVPFKGKIVEKHVVFRNPQDKTKL